MKTKIFSKRVFSTDIASEKKNTVHSIKFICLFLVAMINNADIHTIFHLFVIVYVFYARNDLMIVISIQKLAIIPFDLNTGIVLRRRNHIEYCRSSLECCVNCNAFISHTETALHTAFITCQTIFNVISSSFHLKRYATSFWILRIFKSCPGFVRVPFVIFI